MHRVLFFLVAGLCIGFVSNGCKPDSENKDPQYIIDQCIKVHGSKVFDQSIIEFKIGKRFYKSTREKGQFSYERFWDSLGVTIHDFLTNKGLTRQVGQTEIILDTKKIDHYSSSLRSEMYLFSLPFGFNGSSVIKHYLGDVVLMDQPYHKVKITFKQNPNDRTIHDDEYVAWIHKTKFTLDYIGYIHRGVEESGIRFRQALEKQKASGIIIQNYLEFKPLQDSAAVLPEDLDQAWAGNQMKEFLRVNITQLKIRPK